MVILIMSIQEDNETTLFSGTTVTTATSVTTTTTPTTTDTTTTTVEPEVTTIDLSEEYNRFTSGTLLVKFNYILLNISSFINCINFRLSK